MIDTTIEIAYDYRGQPAISHNIRKRPSGGGLCKLIIANTDDERTLVLVPGYCIKCYLNDLICIHSMRPSLCRPGHIWKDAHKDMEEL